MVKRILLLTLLTLSLVGVASCGRDATDSLDGGHTNGSTDTPNDFVDDIGAIE